VKDDADPALTPGEALDLAEDLKPVFAGILAGFAPRTLKLVEPVHADPVGDGTFAVTVCLLYRPGGWPER
jgi:hypothetical protein